MKIFKLLKSIGFALSLSAIPMLTIAQNSVVTGEVRDAAGNSIPGVNVIQEGTTNGCITDIDGVYSISVPSDATLRFSFMGYETKTAKIEGRQKIDVTMIEDSKFMNEVVIVGYGVQKKKLVTGSTVQVDGTSLANKNTVDAFGAMQSMAPGVNIVQNSGQPGEGYKINIRGLGTTGSSDPLIVIDGVAGGSLDALAPSDIESIDVLKDAATAAIYGSRAANGVILVTTKRGNNSGKYTVSYDGYTGIQNATWNGVETLNAADYMRVVNGTLEAAGSSPYDFATLIPGYYDKYMSGELQGTNWLKEAENKNATLQSHSINIVGGSGVSKVAIGFSHMGQEGTIGKQATPVYQRNTFRLNTDHALWQKNGRDILVFGENATFTTTEKTGVNISGIYSNNIRDLLTTTPLLPAYNDEGDFYVYKDMIENNWDFEQGVDNPLAKISDLHKEKISTSRRLQANGFIEFSPIKELKFRSNAGYHYYQSDYRSYVPVYTWSDKSSNATNDVTNTQSYSTRWTWENTLNYVKSFGDHSIDVLVGQSYENWGIGSNLSVKNSNSEFSSIDQAYIDNVPTVNTTDTRISGTPNEDGRLSSYFGRVNYNFRETYMLSATMRADGSSNFSKDNRWGYFPSASAGWVITNEDFMESTEGWLDILKFRASWGQNGNCDIEPFQYSSMIKISNAARYSFADKDAPLVGAYPYKLANPDITWETSEQLNFGLDGRLLDSRLGVTFDWYKKTTKDWLVEAPTLAIYGADPCYINGGDVENKGYEISLAWNETRGKFRYGATVNLAHNKNEVVRIANSEGIIHGGENVLAQNTAELYRAEVGYAMGYFWGYKTEGVFQNQAEIDAWKAEHGETAFIKGYEGTQAGDLIFADTNNDQEINELDKTEIGNPHPDYTLGINLNFSYKGFDFSADAYGAFGQQIAKCYREFSNTAYHNYTNDVLTKYWTGEGSTNRYPKFTHGKDLNFSEISDIYIEDGDYLKIRNISVGYDFKYLWKNAPVQKLKFYVSVQNLCTFTNYSGFDPEVGYGNSTSWASGIDIGYYPSPRTFMGGLSIVF